MKILILLLALSATNAFAATSDLTSAVKALTKKTVVVRGNVERCSTAAPKEFSDPQLQKEFDAAIKGLTPKAMTAASWKKLNSRNCIADCSCYVLSQLFNAYPEKVRKQLSDKKVKASLARMTDKEYTACFDKTKDICVDPDVAAMVKAIEISYR